MAQTATRTPQNPLSSAVPNPTASPALSAWLHSSLLPGGLGCHVPVPYFVQEEGFLSADCPLSHLGDFPPLPLSPHISWAALTHCQDGSLSLACISPPLIFPQHKAHHQKQKELKDQTKINICIRCDGWSLLGNSSSGETETHQQPEQWDQTGGSTPWCALCAKAMWGAGCPPAHAGALPHAPGPCQLLSLLFHP